MTGETLPAEMFDGYEDVYDEMQDIFDSILKDHWPAAPPPFTQPPPETDAAAHLAAENAAVDEYARIRQRQIDALTQLLQDDSAYRLFGGGRDHTRLDRLRALLIRAKGT